MDYKNVLNQIQQGQFSPVYFFFGEEEYLIDTLVQIIIQKGVDPETRDFNLDVLQGDQTDGESVVNMASSFPMVAQRRVVIVKSIQKLTQADKKLILGYVLSPLDSTCLVLTAGKVDRRQSFYASLAKNSQWVECGRLYENQAVQWIKQYLQNKGITIAPEAAVFLVQQVGSSLGALYQELEKLQTFAWGKKKIDFDEAVVVVGSSRNFNTWELTDAVARKDIGMALPLMNRLLAEGQSPVGMIMDISRRILLLMRLRAVLDKGVSEQEAVRVLQFRPFFAKIYLQQVHKFTLPELETILQILLKADRSIKTGIMKPDLVIALLVYDLTRGEQGRRFFEMS
jgi:DNA polymerase-3 subunit delta